MDTITACEDDIDPPRLLYPVLERQRAGFQGAVVWTAPERRERLRRLEAALKAHQVEVAKAISADFGNRPAAETVMAEIAVTLAASCRARRRLGRWMRPQRRHVGLTFQPGSNRVHYAPLGVVGVVAPWNYPVLLTLGPLVDIIASGNRCMIKPSELAPRTGELLARMLATVFPEDEVAVVLGGVETARSFCLLPFDHLLFTGSAEIGREVMRAAAENLVPVTLELGGKSPVIVAPDFDPGKAGRSVAIGKFLNAGQTCVSPDYALVQRLRTDDFAQAVRDRADAMYPVIGGTPDYASIISERQFTRLREMVAEAEAGGARVLRHRNPPDASARQFVPTVLIDPPRDCRLMREEIFGPVLVVISVDSLDEALAFVNDRPRPLALYAYTNDKATRRRILGNTVSGGVTINGTLIHCVQPDMPFGGVGPSGIGGYRGREGFLRFSHARAVHRAGIFSGFETFRPPYGWQTRALLRAMTGFRQPSTRT